MSKSKSRFSRAPRRRSSSGSRCISGGGGGSFPPCGPLDVNIVGGTELQVELAATELGCVLDANLEPIGKVVLCKTVSESDGSETTVQNAYMYDGTVIPNYTGPFGPCNPEEPKGDIHTVCLLDDVNGDGTELINYVEAYCRTIDNGVVSSMSVGLFTDQTLTTPYVLQGTSVDPEDVGVAAETKQGREVVENGFSWSPNQLMTCYTIRVSTVADPANPPTYQDSFGNITPLEAGEVVTYSIKSELLDAAPIVRTNTGDRIVITSVSLGAQ